MLLDSNKNRVALVNSLEDKHSHKDFECVFGTIVTNGRPTNSAEFLYAALQIFDTMFGKLS